MRSLWTRAWNSKAASPLSIRQLSSWRPTEFDSGLVVTVDRPIGTEGNASIWSSSTSALFGAISVLPRPARADDAAVTAQLQQVLDAYVKERAPIEGLSGAALQVDRGAGKPILAVYAGDNGLSDKKPIGPDTLFQIGSNTKEFTAALILKLEAAGKLKHRRHDREMAAAISGMEGRHHPLAAADDEPDPELFGDGRHRRDRGRRHPSSVQRQGPDRLRRSRRRHTIFRRRPDGSTPTPTTSSRASSSRRLPA